MLELSISIPTYDRPDFLRKTLKLLASQILAWKGVVGIFVSDDHPSGKNREVVEAIKKQHPLIALEYAHNLQNIGIDENIKTCIISPQSRFVWLLGEDDIILPGAIDIVMGIIKKKNPAFIFANYIYCDDQHLHYAKRAVIDESPGIALMSFNDFISCNIHLLGFIGGCIINRHAWVETHYEKFKGSFYTHVGGILESCCDREIVVINNISVLNRAEDVNTFTWSKSTFEVYFSFFDVVCASSVANNPRLLEECLKSAQKLFAVDNLLWLAAKRADGVYDVSIFQSKYRTRAELTTWWKLCAAIISVAPRTPLQFLRWLQLKNRFSRKVI